MPAQKNHLEKRMKPVIFLFDLDGVLVRPGGYRAAVQATVNHFARWLGLPEMAPDEPTIAIFEAQGITGEWDMIPLSLAILLDHAAALLPAASYPSLAALRAQISAHPLASLPVDYAPVIRRLGAYLQPGEAPADVFLAVCQAGQDGALFPHLSGQGVLCELLSNTRKLALSPTTRIFEHLVLGHEFYQQSLGLPVEIESEAYLTIHDRPLLTPETRARLLDLRATGALVMAAYTARPSAWEGDWPSAEPLPAMFAPEAEMALQLVGMQSIPLVGYGQMGGLALSLRLAEEALLKPSPYHAMTAIASAWTGSRLAAQEWLARLYSSRTNGALTPGLSTGAGALPQAAEVHIFEDSSIGMAGGKQAVALLQELGMQVNLHLWGVSTHAEKTSALQAVGANRVFTDVNQAVAHALSISGLSQKGF
jgi:hypothetical protein